MIAYLRQNPFATLLVMLIVMQAGWFKFLAGDWIYPIDYLQRIIVIVIFFVCFADSRSAFPPPTRPLVVSLIAIAIAFLLFLSSIGFGISESLLRDYVRYAHFGFPEIDRLDFRIFDHSVGLVLVALSEEMVYRHTAVRVLVRWNLRPIWIYTISATIFALLHAPQGAQGVVISFTAGLVLMYLYRRYHGLWAPVIAHYFVNLMAYHLRPFFEGPVPPV